MPLHYDIANYELIKSHVRRTPLIRNAALDAEVGAWCFFKCENVQKTGSFKYRGAIHSLLQLSAAARERGVVTVSSGNHGAAIAKAGQELGVDVHVIVPENIRPAKLANIRRHAPHIVFSKAGVEGRRAALEAFQTEHDCCFIPPYNHPDVILGQASAACELLQDEPDLDAIFVPVGGGGLASGTILAAQLMAPGTAVIGAEPANADDAFRSLRDGKLYPQTNPDTICDGLRTGLGDITFAILQRGMAEIILVTEQEVVDATRTLSGRLAMAIEPSSATVYAAVLKRKDQFEDGRLGFILSGGNMDAEVLDGDH